MDGEADDFVINEDGELVPAHDEWENVTTVGRVQALTVITQDTSGMVAVQVYGVPTEKLVRVIAAVLSDLPVDAKQH